MMHDVYEELMSLKLDGLIDDFDERRLEEHLAHCDSCLQLWDLLQQADSILWASAHEPLPVPATFHAKVMVQVAAPALQPVAVAVAVAVPAPSQPLFLPGTTGRLGEIPSFVGVGVPALAASVPSHTRRLLSNPTAALTDNADWQRRTVGYLRNAAAVILALTGVAALFLALAMSGVIQLGGALGDQVSTLRTFFEAMGAWFQSLATASGSAMIAGSAILLGILLLVGWQVVASYQRGVVEGRGHTGALTGALTGPLEVAA